MLLYGDLVDSGLLEEGAVRLGLPEVHDGIVNILLVRYDAVLLEEAAQLIAGYKALAVLVDVLENLLKMLVLFGVFALKMRQIT